MEETIPDGRQEMENSKSQHTMSWGDRCILFGGLLIIFLLLYFASPIGDKVLEIGVAILCAVGMSWVSQAGMLWIMGLDLEILWKSGDGVREEERWQWVLARVFGASVNFMVALGIQLIEGGGGLVEEIQMASMWIGAASLLPIAHGSGLDTATTLFSFMASDRQGAYRIVGVLSLLVSIAMYAAWKMGTVPDKTLDWAVYILGGSMIALYRGFLFCEEEDRMDEKGDTR